MVKISKKIGWEIAKNTLLPVIVLFSFIGAYIAYRIKIQPFIPERVHLDIRKYISTLLVVCVAFILHRIARAVVNWYKENVAAKTVSQLDDDLIPIVSRTLKIVIWVIALLVILPFYGVNISALITALGVGSLAIALAAQDTIANIIAGFMIMVDRPFRMGDRIKLVTGEVVKVLNIGVRRTEFLAEDGSIVILPNVDLSRNKIVNYTYGEERKRNGL
ncbi:mechanosensitive ion channel family protein [Candidatus Omnitrophota bacterium]